MIPKIVHQIWIQGLHSLPEDLMEKHKLIQSSNPNYQVILWDDDKIVQILYQKHPQILNLYKNVEYIPGPVNMFATKSDIARFVILYEFGGFYIDTDYYCSLDLDTIIAPDTEIIFADNTYKILNPFQYFIYTPKYNLSFCAVKPKHQMWKQVFLHLYIAKDRVDIGTAADRTIQRLKINPQLFPTDIVSTHTSCKVNRNCYTTTLSSGFKLRPYLPLLCNISCYIQIWILIFILLLFLVCYSLTLDNRNN